MSSAPIKLSRLLCAVILGALSICGLLAGSVQSLPALASASGEAMDRASRLDDAPLKNLLDQRLSGGPRQARNFLYSVCWSRYRDVLLYLNIFLVSI